MAIDCHMWAFVFGLLGNIISFLVFLAPVPTFYKIYQKKSTEGFQSLPYVVALFSAMLWIYYALLKRDATLLITINLVGCVIETTYILLFLYYAPKKARIDTIKLLLLLNVFGFGLMLCLTLLLAKGANRLTILGWICLVFNISVFAAPLCVMRQVIKTKSMEYMPFQLSFFLTLNAVMWLFYGLLLKDRYAAYPNVLGFIFGIVQMVLYVVCKTAKKMKLAPLGPVVEGTNSNGIEAVIAPDAADQKMSKDDIEAAGDQKPQKRNEDTKKGGSVNNANKA